MQARGRPTALTHRFPCVRWWLMDLPWFRAVDDGMVTNDGG